MIRYRCKLAFHRHRQILILPPGTRLPASTREVDVLVGCALGSWDEWFDGPPVSDDFMADRQQPHDPDG